MTTDAVIWLYAVTYALPPRAIAGITGVDGEPVRTLAHGGTEAVVGTVAAARFGEHALKGNLEDLDWLSATARAHDAVVRAVARAGAAIPMRLATVYRDDRRVCAMLRERSAELRAALRQLAGRTEWGAKVYQAQAPAEPVAAADSGTAYLRRRSAQLTAQRERSRTAAERADVIHRELAALAVAARRNPAQDPKLSGRTAAMLLNGAYLVDQSRTGEFTAAAAGLNTRYAGIQVELTGPWPPYSFTGATR